MKTSMLFWSYPTQFPLEWKMFQTKVLCSLTFLKWWANCDNYEIMWKNVVELGRPQMTIWCMCIACRILKATKTHTQNMQYLLLFHHNCGYMNVSHCYITRTLPVLLTGNACLYCYVWHHEFWLFIFIYFSLNWEKCGDLHWYEKVLRSIFSMPVWNQYFCTDVKHGLLQVKFDVRYKLLLEDA